MNRREHISVTRRGSLLVLAITAALAMIIAWGIHRRDGSTDLTELNRPAGDLLDGGGLGRVNASVLPTEALSISTDGGAPHDEPAASLSSLVAALSTLIDSELQNNIIYRRYLECIASQGPDALECRRARSDAIFYVLDVAVGPMLSAQADSLHALVVQFGADAVISQLMSSLSSAQTENERLAALSVLTRAELPPRTYPAEAYAVLETASVPEQTMLMAPHEVLPITDGALVRRVSEVAAAVGTDVRTQRACLKALGHAETGEVLGHVASAMRVDSDAMDRVWLPLSEALGRCSPGCVDTVESLANGTRSERMIAYQAIITAFPGQAGAYQDALVRIGPPPDADEEERAIRDHAIHLGER